MNDNPLGVLEAFDGCDNFSQHEFWAWRGETQGGGGGKRGRNGITSGPMDGVKSTCHATGYEVRCLACQLAGFAGV